MSDDFTFKDGWEAELRLVSDAIFGQWNDEKLRRTPGILERLARIEAAILFIGVLVAVRFLGIPTEKLFPMVWSLVTGRG